MDSAEWCNALQGAAETSGSSRLGTVIGGRGCVQDMGNNEYLVTIAWQGLVPISAPPAGVACGKDLYDDRWHALRERHVPPSGHHAGAHRKALSRTLVAQPRSAD